jgi:hypothetical protein
MWRSETMIVTEMIDDRIRHYSDRGMKIRQVETGIIYEDAVDIVPCPYTYVETDEPIDDVDAEIY